jgi:hypothetical protein
LDIFLDTGVVFGWSFDEDKFHSNAVSFVKKYPSKRNTYYSTKNILEIEIKKLTWERTNGLSRRIRKISQFYKQFCESVKDVTCHTHAAYTHLRRQIYRFLSSDGDLKKDRDAIYLTNALIWDGFTEKLVTPHFITTDKKDIYENKEYLSTMGVACLNCKLDLKIEYLPNMVE